MKKNFYFFFLFLLFHFTAAAQFSRLWVQPYIPSPNGGLQSVFAHIDSNNNLFVFHSQNLTNNLPVLLKYDVSGNTLCSSVLPIPPGAGPVMGLFKDQSGYFYLGYADFSSTSVEVLKYDSGCNWISAKSDTISDGYTGLFQGSMIMNDRSEIFTTKTFWQYNQGNSNSTYVIHKFDSAFHFKWSYIIPDTTGSYYSPNAMSIFTHHQNLYVIYNLSYYKYGTTMWDTYLIKVDSSGNKCWSAFLSSGYPIGRLVADDSENVYFSYQDGIPGGYSLRSGKIDSSGVLQWSNTYSGNSPKRDYPSKILLDQSGNLYELCACDLSVSNSVGMITLLKYNGLNGQLMWLRSYQGNETTGTHSYNWAGDLKMDSNQNLFISGTLADTLTKGDAFLVQLDTGGNVIWSDLYEYGNFQNDFWQELIFTNNQQGFYALGRCDTNQYSNQSFMVNAFYCKGHCALGVEPVVDLPFTIYPNPAGAFCILKAQSFLDATLLLSDLTGRVLKKQPFNSYEYLDVESLKPGIYFVEINDRKGRKQHGSFIRH